MGRECDVPMLERRHCLDHSGMEEGLDSTAHCLSNFKEQVLAEFVTTRVEIKDSSATIKWLLGSLASTVLVILGFMFGQVTTLSREHSELKEKVSVNTEKLSNLKAFDERVEKLINNLEQVLQERTGRK